jgi:AAA domain/DnaB-like helicase N terminal domain
MPHNSGSNNSHIPARPSLIHSQRPLKPRGQNGIQRPPATTETARKQDAGTVEVSHAIDVDDPELAHFFVPDEEIIPDQGDCVPQRSAGTMRTPALTPGEHLSEKGGHHLYFMAGEEDAERAIIGALLLATENGTPQPVATIFAELEGGDFGANSREDIFTTARQLHERGDPITHPLVAHELCASAGYNTIVSELALARELASSGTELLSHIRIVADSSKRRRLLSLGDLAQNLALSVQASGDHEAVSAAAAMIREALDALDRPSIASRPQFPIVSAAELAHGDYRVAYIVERLLVEDQFCVLGGPKKCLKTSLAIALAISIALEIPFLDRFRVNGRRRVLVCTCEAGLAVVKNIARRICCSLGVDLVNIAGLSFCPNVPKLNDASSWAGFQRVVQEHSPDVLILDPFYRMFDGEGAENLFKVAVPLNRVDDYCRSNSITPLLCHHLKTVRSNYFAQADLDDLAFSGTSEFARQWLLVNRREAYDVGSGLHLLHLNIGGSAGHNSSWALDVEEGRFDDAADDLCGRFWRTCVRQADEARADAQRLQAEARESAGQARLVEDQGKIFDALRRCPEQRGTKTELRDGSGLNSSRFGAALAVLLHDRRLTPAQVNKGNNRHYPGYTFSQNERCQDSRNGTQQDSASG